MIESKIANDKEIEIDAVSIDDHLASNPKVDLIKMDIREMKNLRRENIENNADESNNIGADDDNNDDITEYGNELLDVEIISGEKDELKKTVCSLIMDFITIENRNKNAIDYPYKNILTRIQS